MKYMEILAGSIKPGDKDWGYLPCILVRLSVFTWCGAWIYPSEHNINFA